MRKGPEKSENLSFGPAWIAKLGFKKEVLGIFKAIPKFF